MAAAWDVHINFEWHGYHWYDATFAAVVAAVLFRHTFTSYIFLLTCYVLVVRGNKIIIWSFDIFEFMIYNYFHSLLWMLLLLHYKISVGQRWLQGSFETPVWRMMLRLFLWRPAWKVLLQCRSGLQQHCVVSRWLWWDVNINTIWFFTNNIWAEINVWVGLLVRCCWVFFLYCSGY